MKQRIKKKTKDNESYFLNGHFDINVDTSTIFAIEVLKLKSPKVKIVLSLHRYTENTFVNSMTVFLVY